MKNWKLAEGESLNFEAGLQMQRVIRSAWMVTLVNKGRWEISTPGFETVARVGDLIWIPSGMPCDYRVPPGSLGHRLRLRAGLLQPQSAPDLELLNLMRLIDKRVAKGGAVLPLTPTTRRHIQKNLPALESVWRRPSMRFYTARIKNLVVDLLLRLGEDVRLARALSDAQSAHPGRDARKRLAPAFQLLENQDVIARDSLRIAELASACGYGTSRFHSLFVEATGMTPVRYITERRIALACRLLRNPRADILKTAFSCGFGSASRFYKAFQQITGTSPAAWRRQE